MTEETSSKGYPGNVGTTSVAALPASAVECFLTSKQLRVPRVLVFIIAGLAIFIPLYHLYTAWFGGLQPQVQRRLILAIIMVLGFLLHPLGKKSWKGKLGWPFAIDLCFILMTIVPFVYVMVELERYLTEVGSPTTMDLVTGIMSMVALIEITRRVIGWPMVIVGVFFLVQNIFAPYFPGPLYGPAVPLQRAIQLLHVELYGLYGVPIQTVTDFLVVFFVLAALLNASGAGAIFINVASALAGRFSGGPAKIGVVGGALFGTITGSGVADVVGVGTFTIPMMKRMGFKPHVAAAVQATASSGAQIMPPILGITAFLIAQFLGISYFTVALAALIPAILYFTGVFVAVHFEAAKSGLRGLPKEEIPRLRPSLMESWVVLVPLLALVFFLWQGFPLARSALWATLILFATSMIRKKSRLSATSVLVTLEDAGKMAVGVGVACGMAGAVVSVFYASGVGDKLGLAIVDLSGGQLWIAALLTAIVAIILGMGVPTVIVYILLLYIAIPTLIKMGVIPLAAHLFAFYFGVMSGITPPVSIVAFVAAGIAGAGMMRTGLEASRIGILAFIIPFLMIWSPEILMIGSPGAIVFRFATAAVGVVALGVGMAGWLHHKVKWMGRIILILAGAGLFAPMLISNLAGVTLLAVVVLWHMMGVRAQGRSPEAA